LIPLLVDLETAWRGGQNQALLILKGLYEHGHGVELVATEGSALGARASAHGICVHFVSRKLLRFSAASMIRKVMNDGRIDIVHANEAHAVTASWLARAHRRVPLIISRRVGYPLGKNFISRAKYAAAARIVANSQWVADQAANSGARREKLSVVYEGTEIPKKFMAEQRNAARARWGVAEGQPLLGCVGVLLPDKGQEWLIRALAELRMEFPNAKLLLAGDGICRPKLESLANELGVSNAVIFAGFVKDVENVYAALDVFLLPSFFEALNNSLLAAMAYEIPSIAFNRGALGEIIENGKSGLLVSGPNVSEIAIAVKTILQNPALAKQFGAAGRQRVEENFSADRMVEGMIAVYNSVLNAGSDLWFPEKG
jgi:glycosyltransferase involved in cell wall biosynthesis